MNQAEFDKRIEAMDLSSYEKMDLRHALEKISVSRTISVFDRHGHGMCVHTLKELADAYERGFRA